MEVSLQHYVTTLGEHLQVKSLILTDQNGVELARYGSGIDDLQLMAALFQSSVDNTAKLPINSAKTIILDYPSLLIIQHNL